MCFTCVLTRLCSCFFYVAVWAIWKKGLGESLSDEFLIHISVFCIRQA